MPATSQDQAGFRDGMITVRTGSLKSQWLAHCRKQGKRSSELIRQFMSSQIEDSQSRSNAAPIQSAISNLDDFHRLEIKIAKSTHSLLCKRALDEGFPSANRFTAALVTVQIERMPQLSFSEYEALIHSNRQLLAIGRNLNQLVIDIKTANANGSDLSVIGDFRFGVLEQLREQISRHSTLVRQVLAANITRWNA